jgi:hypothetical protein
MHDDFWTIPTANMTYTRSETYTNMVVGKHRIENIKSCGLLLLLVFFDFFVPTRAHFLLFLDKWFVQIYLNVDLVTNELINHPPQHPLAGTSTTSI